jgi:hypothetical protein
VGITVQNQNAGGNINNVEGTLYAGGQQVSYVSVEDARRALQELAAVLPRVPMPHRDRLDTDAAVRDIDEELRRPDPDKSRVAEHVGRLTKVLSAAGALASTALGVAVPLGSLVGWLGRTVASFL